MRVLSLFDGISCARVALGDRVTQYWASEIDKHAMTIAKKNYPDTQHVGDVCSVTGEEYLGIDLLIGGSPCTDLSIAKKDRQGLAGDRSKLFWEYVRILREAKPRWFILENVASMPKADRDIITKELGVEPVMIDAALVSAQSRKRLFWTNIPGVVQPADRGIVLRDILQPDAEVDASMNVQVGYVGKDNHCKVGGQAMCVYSADGKSTTSGVGLYKLGHIGNSDAQANRVYSTDGKSTTLSANGGGLGAKTGLYQVQGISKPVVLGESPLQVLVEGRTELGKQSRKDIKQQTGKDSTSRGAGHKAYFGREGTKANCLTTQLGAEGHIVKDAVIRKLTPIECERLQGLPDNYTEGISKTQRYKCLGNAFHVEVIRHILSFLP